MTRQLTTAVVVCTASAERERLLRECVRSLLSGDRVPDEILVVVDHNPALEASVAGWLPTAVRLLRSEAQGNSASRNAGLRAASSDVVAFVDDDAAVEPDWLRRIVEPFAAADRVLGAGGAVVPDWEGDARWLPDELLWVVGCTYLGHPDTPGPIRNPIGCNMAFRRRELCALGGFSAEFGKCGARPSICDETEACLRLERAHGLGRVVFVPTARVRHHIPAARIGWDALLRRCVSEGLSKHRLRRLYGRDALGTERAYAIKLMTERVPRLLARGIASRDPRPIQGAAAIVLSLAVTGAFYAGGEMLGPRAVGD
jgi:glycosyltransferase involved in cell wall biosynthesis